MELVSLFIIAPAIALIWALLVWRFGANSRPGFDHRELRDPDGRSTGFDKRT
jgi:hypothetical protein